MASCILRVVSVITYNEYASIIHYRLVQSDRYTKNYRRQSLKINLVNNLNIAKDNNKLAFLAKHKNNYLVPHRALYIETPKENSPKDF